MLPYYQDSGVTIYHGGVRDALAELPDESVQCVVTSPPYWGLRDYGVDGQLGLEATPDEYVASMTSVFRDVRRVLRSDGVCWVNMGDSYASGGCGSRDEERWPKQSRNDHMATHAKKNSGLKPKDLCGIPWRLAFALQADGWYLRQDIIWHKPNPMPESVRDRCTKAHEYVFLLARSERYWWDAEALKEPVTGLAHDRGNGVNPKARWKTPDGWDTSTGEGKHGTFHKDGREKGHIPTDVVHNATRAFRAKNGQKSLPTSERNGVRPRQNESFSAAVNRRVLTRNKRSVWTVATQPYSGAHFATFPPDLIAPMILAGCPRDGVVLDPFHGAGTTALVCRDTLRRYVGIELNAEYIDLSLDRLKKPRPTSRPARTDEPLLALMQDPAERREG